MRYGPDALGFAVNPAPICRGIPFWFNELEGTLLDLPLPNSTIHHEWFPASWLLANTMVREQGFHHARRPVFMIRAHCLSRTEHHDVKEKAVKVVLPHILSQVASL